MMKWILVFAVVFTYSFICNSHISQFQKLFNWFNQESLYQEVSQHYILPEDIDKINKMEIRVTEPPKVNNITKGNIFSIQKDSKIENKDKSTPIPQRVLDLDLMLTNENKAQCSNCIIINRNMQIDYLSFQKSKKLNQMPVNPDDKVTVSIVTTCTAERLPYIPYILSRWPGNLVISMQLKYEEREMIIRRITSMDLPKRVFIILMPVHKGSTFQINKLRNIAISSVITTHIMIMDMDLWPARNLFSEIQSLPQFILDSPSSAVIVPEFFLKPEPLLENCTFLMDCAIKSERLFPVNKTDFIQCYNKRQCLTRKFNGVQHMYVERPWFVNRDHYLTMKCFKNRLQEPYLLLKVHTDMLLFDERFVNYGCNKVQYVDLLRESGYQFYLFTQTFAMDIVHHDSPYRKHYLGYARAGLSDSMRKLCFDFMAKVELHYNNISRVKVCDDLYQYVVCLKMNFWRGSCRYERSTNKINCKEAYSFPFPSFSDLPPCGSTC